MHVCIEQNNSNKPHLSFINIHVCFERSKTQLSCKVLVICEFHTQKLVYIQINMYVIKSYENIEKYDHVKVLN